MLDTGRRAFSFGKSRARAGLSFAFSSTFCMKKFGKVEA